MASMEDGVCRNQSLTSAVKAMVDSTSPDLTEVSAPVAGVDELLRPKKIEEKIPALLPRLESFHDFDEFYGLLLLFCCSIFPYSI